MEQYSLELVRRLTQVAGLSGNEGEVGALFEQELKGVGTMERDRVGTRVCTLPGSNPDGPRILFAAHQDEIGFLVSDITEAGFLRIHAIGGWNTLTLPSSPVTVVASDGTGVPGIIGQISPHFLRKGAPVQVPDLEDLFVDVGARSAREVGELFGISLGSLVVPVSPFQYVRQTNSVMSKAFDDRIGVAALIEVGRRLAGLPHEATIVLAATVQEEVGTRGAAVLANWVDADLAVVVEGAPADDMPGGPPHPQTCAGKGAHVRIFDPTHIGHPGLLAHVRSVAKANNIRIQEAVRKGGGTDAVHIALSGRGIPTVVTGVPVRYAHSHNCLVSMDDYGDLIDLLVAVCLATTGKTACVQVV